jgi:hypothetical protein
MAGFASDVNSLSSKSMAFPETTCKSRAQRKSKLQGLSSNGCEERAIFAGNIMAESEDTTQTKQKICFSHRNL